MAAAVPLSPSLQQLLTKLRDCWSRAFKEGNPDLIYRKWQQGWLAAWQTIYQGASEDEQDEFYRRWEEIAGDWALWEAFLLAQLGPFNLWPRWQRRCELPKGPVVAVAPGGPAQVISGRGFVLPVLPGQPGPKQEIKDGKITFWPHNQPIPRFLRRFRAILMCCLIRNMLSFAVEPINILLLLANVLAFAGAVIWREQPDVLESLLKASRIAAACQTCYAVFQIVREFYRARNERWFWIWKRSTVRVTGDPTGGAQEVTGESDDLSLLFELLAALAERVQREHLGGPLKSRFAAMMLKFIDNRGLYAATGRLGRLWFFLIFGVGDIERKRKAVDEAELPRFFVPATLRNMWMRLKQIWNPQLRRTRLLLCGSVPGAAMKAGGTYRGGAVFCTLLTIAVVVTFIKEWRILRPAVVPVFSGSAPRLDMKNASLDVGFNPVSHLGEVFFVRLLLSIPRGEDLPPLVIPRDGDLRVESDDLVAHVPLEYEGAIQDPIRVMTPSATLYRARTVWWFRLPLAVKTFEMPRAIIGLPPVDFTCGGAVQAAPFRCTAVISNPPAPFGYKWQAADACRLIGLVNNKPEVDLIATEAGGAQCFIALTVTTSKGKNTDIVGYAQKKLIVEPANVPVKVLPRSSGTAPAQRVGTPPALIIFPLGAPGSPDTTEGWLSGHVNGQNPDAYKVAIYSEPELNHFELTDIATIKEGNWTGKIKRGVSYTAVLVRPSIDENKLRSLAALGKEDIVDKKMIEANQ